MVPVDLLDNCEDWIYGPDGSGIHILVIRSRDPFPRFTDKDMSVCHPACD